MQHIAVLLLHQQMIFVFTEGRQRTLIPVIIVPRFVLSKLQCFLLRCESETTVE